MRLLGKCVLVTVLDEGMVVTMVTKSGCEGGVWVRLVDDGGALVSGCEICR